MPRSTRPRIGVDFHTFDGIFQGSRSHLIGLYEAAVAMAPDIDFYLLLDETERLRREHPAFAAPNVHLIRMPTRRAPIRLAWQLPRLQQQLQLDVFHLQYRLPLWTSGPCVCTIHDVLFESHPQFFSPAFVQFARLSSRDALRRAKALFTVSEYSRQAMAGAYGVPVDRITVTHNGVDVQRFTPGDEGADLVRARGLVPGQYLCTVGRLEPRKNHVNLLKAYAQLPQPRPPLLVIGQRDFSFQAIFDVVTAHGLKDQVKFLEHVGDAELPALIRHSAAFVYPTWAEGFGMPVLEAMACGVSVVTSNNTALPEVVGDLAWMCDAADVTSIAHAMESALKEPPASRQQRHVDGMARARGFSWQRSAEQLLGVLRTQVARG